ncbi:hypothetical protein PCE1_004822 [Barthelona sp. PCE]
MPVFGLLNTEEKPHKLTYDSLLRPEIIARIKTQIMKKKVEKAAEKNRNRSVDKELIAKYRKNYKEADREIIEQLKATKQKIKESHQKRSTLAKKFEKALEKEKEQATKQEEKTEKKSSFMTQPRPHKPVPQPSAKGPRSQNQRPGRVSGMPMLSGPPMSYAPVRTIPQMVPQRW